MITKQLLGATTALALLLVAPVAAQADSSPTGSDSQDFAHSQGGWTQSTATEGACVPSLVCPTVTNDFVAAGGAGGAGDGYIRTQFATLTTTMAGAATGVWESPAFVYRGHDGAVPGTALVDLSIKPALGALPGLSLQNASTYKVDLVDQDTGLAVSARPTTTLTSDTGWTALPSAEVNPALLALGHSYKIRIATTLQETLGANGTGEVGYDNVRLTTSPRTLAAGPAVAASGITQINQLRKLVKTEILPKSTKLVGNKLKVKLVCPAIAAPRACKITLQGLAAGKFSKPATARKFVTLKAGNSRTVLIRVKPKYVATYTAAKKIFVKTTVRVGQVRVTVRKSIKLRG
jgi:hypothetical protein